MTGISVGRSGRAGAVVAAVLVALSPIAILPHIVEDAREGAFESLGLEPMTGALIVGGALALQVLLAYACLRDRRWANAGIVVIGVLWVLAAVIDHPGAFTTATFRAGLSSRLAVWGIVLLQGGAAIAALMALRSTRQTSFRGTGRFNV